MKLFSKNNLIFIIPSWKTKLSLVRQEKVFTTPIVIFSLLSLFILIVLLLTWQRLPPQVPLFYSLPWGEEQLGNRLSFLLLPLICLLVGIVNLLLAITVFAKHPLAAKILPWTSVAVSSLISVTLLEIVLLIT